MPRAVWNDTVIAESEDTIVVERNHYFPLDAVKHEYLRESDTHTSCPWKGVASYYNLEVNGERSRDAAWYDPHPTPLARNVRGRVAFWRGVKIVYSEQERAARKGRGLSARLLRAA